MFTHTHKIHITLRVLAHKYACMCRTKTHTHARARALNNLITHRRTRAHSLTFRNLYRRKVNQFVSIFSATDSVLNVRGEGEGEGRGKRN